MYYQTISVKNVKWSKIWLQCYGIPLVSINIIIFRWCSTGYLHECCQSDNFDIFSGTIAALLQEIVNIYPVINPPNLTVSLEKKDRW
jgi:hypothetical protein